MKQEDYTNLGSKIKDMRIQMNLTQADSLIGKIDSDYQETALDRELFTQIQKMDPESKEKLLKTLKIWGNE